jgi:hypothetical protein
MIEHLSMLIMAPARIDTNTNEREIKTVGIVNKNLNQ